MTKQQIKELSARDAQLLYGWYQSIVSKFEDLYGGPRGAAQHREYFALRDTANNLYRHYQTLILSSHG